MKLNDPERQKSERQNSWQEVKPAELTIYSDLLQRENLVTLGTLRSGP